MSISIEELEANNYVQKFDYTQYSHDNHVNVIPEESFHHLVTDTFKVITDTLRKTYGPYGSTIMISDQNETTTTKDGYNIYCALGFSHHYKRMVYLAIKKIIERVNNNVGDGTTSCILLAEKMFNHINAIVKNQEDKRNVKKILDDIEEYLQSNVAIQVDSVNGVIAPLTEWSLNNLIMLASNYDTDLTDYVMNALNPICEHTSDPNSKVTKINNVIVDTDNPYEVSKTTYKIDHLPGKYRVRVHMDTEFALSMSQPERVKILLYDHTFGASDWVNFFEGYDKESKIFIIARNFSKTFLDNEYVRYLKQLGLVKQPVKVYLCQIKGTYVQDELLDLGAVLNTKVRSINELTVDMNEVAEATVSVYNLNCLCFHDVEPPEDYITKLFLDYQNEKSYVKQTLLDERVRALKMDTSDALITVKAESSLEMKMISDKIDDCIHIARSAFNYGVVPNLLWYGFDRVLRHTPSDDQFSRKIHEAIEKSILELSDDIYYSKHANPSNEEKDLWEKQKDLFYLNDHGAHSFDIINDETVDRNYLPTSAQYDMEILIASISIVKYLLSSRALIFDAFLMTPQGDQGHFVRNDD